MAKLIRLAERRTAGSFVHFNRAELTLLLALYTRRVAAGEWRDYAIDQGGGRAVFSIFRHTLDRPLFTVTKLGDGTKLGEGTKPGDRATGGRATGGRNGRRPYVVAAGERVLARSASLAEALAVFDRVPRLVVP